MDQTTTATTNGQDPKIILQKRSKARFLSIGISTALWNLNSPGQSSYCRCKDRCCQVQVQSDGRLQTYYCGDRWCIVCSRIRTAKAINAYMPTVEQWKEPYFFTVSLPNVPAHDLRRRYAEMLKGFRFCVRKINEKRGKNGQQFHLTFQAIRKFEVTWNSTTRLVHPHFHVVCEGYMQAVLFIMFWLEYFPEASSKGQDLRPCDETGLVELFKYFTSVTTKTKDGRIEIIPAKVLDIIFRQIKGLRVSQPVGFTIDKTIEDAIEGEIEVKASQAWKRLGEQVDWAYDMEATDWVDHNTGEVLSDCELTPEFKRFVDHIMHQDDQDIQPGQQKGLDLLDNLEIEREIEREIEIEVEASAETALPILDIQTIMPVKGNYRTQPHVSRKIKSTTTTNAPAQQLIRDRADPIDTG